MKFWSGMATGAPVGLAWYDWSHFHRLRLTPASVAVHAVGGAVMFIVAVAVVAPELDSQEAERAKLRAIAVNDISVISIHTGERVSRCNDPKGIVEFVESLRRSTLFYSNHEGSISEFQLVIFLKDGTRLEYKGRVPERHRSDVSLGFRGPSWWSEILVPDCRDWLLKVAPNAIRKD
jgi:hypothetical protein